MKRDLANRRFGRLTVIRQASIDRFGHRKWLCQCDCGNTKVVRAQSLLSGHTKSCGCLNREEAAKRLMGHGLHTKHGLRYTRLYRIWADMKARCYNPNSTVYRYYMERGIKICSEWLHDFLAFYRWAMANGYEPNLSIDRINNNGGYEPSNCRWATSAMQATNRKFSIKQRLDNLPEIRRAR